VVSCAKVVGLLTETIRVRIAAKNWLGAETHTQFGLSGPCRRQSGPSRRLYKLLRIHLELPHFQLRISGKSSPCLSMYCLCSMSLSCTICFR
jgi:hypothetical protein